MIKKLILTLHYACSSLSMMTQPTEMIMKQPIQAIIFDMDGTVLNTEPVWERGNRHILATHAPHLTPDQVNQIIECHQGIRTQDELAIMLQKHCTPFMSIAHIREMKTAYVLHLYETEGVAFIPYFHEFHTKLSKLGLQSAIATNATGDALEKLIIKTPLQTYFSDHIYHVDHVNKAYKPSPDVYLHAAKMLGVEPCHCIAIEDSASGIKAAKAAGMYCIGINTGKNRAALAQADEIVDCYTEIDLEQLSNL